MKGDPLYQARRTLHTGDKLLTDRQRTRLKKLFADPHFNVMDGLDVYIEDYNLTTPIAENTMRRLVQARTLRLFDDVEQAEPGPGDSDSASLAASTASPTTPASSTTTTSG